MDPRRIYTKKNLDPDLNPPQVVEGPKRLLRKKKRKVEVEPSIALLYRSISFPKEGVIIVDDIQFDEKFELYLLRFRSDLDLSQVVFNQEKFNSFIPSKSSGFSKEAKENIWDSLTSRLKEQLQHIESLKDSDPLYFLINRKLDTKI